MFCFDHVLRFSAVRCLAAHSGDPGNTFSCYATLPPAVCPQLRPYETTIDVNLDVFERIWWLDGSSFANWSTFKMYYSALPVDFHSSTGTKLMFILISFLSQSPELFLNWGCNFKSVEGSLGSSTLAFLILIFLWCFWIWGSLVALPSPQCGKCAMWSISLRRRSDCHANGTFQWSEDRMVQGHTT